MPDYDFLSSLCDLSPAQAAGFCEPLPGLVFFDSARGDEGSYSLLAARPLEIIRGEGPESWRRLEEELEKRRVTSEGRDGVPRSGFAAGWAEYDGAICFGIYEGALLYRHGREGEPGRWEVAGDPEAVLPLVEAIRTQTHQPGPAPQPKFSAVINRETYIDAVRQVHERIAAGDIYQVNLTHPFRAEWRAEWSAYAFYLRLRAASPAPYAAYLSLEQRRVLSSSPELFLKIDGRQIETRPIKGTRPRGSSEQEDEAFALELRASRKEAAELVMITDLERNDLGQICEYGSVEVRELLKLERYRHVFHLVSTVQGRLRSEVDAVAAFRACFPGGSITGAPKKRAREVIAELEREPRGLYTGAIGYFGFDGQAQFSIAIRTAVIDPEGAHFHVGAGIVADSLPEAEWEETLHKARGILLAAEGEASAKSEIATCEKSKGKLDCPA